MFVLETLLPRNIILTVLFISFWQAEQAADLRRRNLTLIHNVLPPHVARHFMGARHHHRDLYSQSYAEVGVLFASMPNFTGKFYWSFVNN